MKIKNRFLLLCMVLNCAIAMAQYKAPVYNGKRNFDYFVAVDLSHILGENLPDFKDSSIYINDLFFMRFNIDSCGNVCNIHFSNENESEHDREEFSTIPVKMRKRLNSQLDSAITCGKWIPAKQNGVACMSKPLLLVFLCTRGVCNGKKRKVQDTGGKIFGGNEEFTILSYIHNNGVNLE